MRLRIFNAYEHLATLTWEAGELSATEVHPDFQSAVDRWRTQGVVDRVENDEGDVVTRVTTVDDAEFLPRLAGRIRRQFSRQTVELETT